MNYMQIYLENYQNREGDWFNADFYNPNYFGIDLSKAQRACGTSDPKELMVIDIDYKKDEPYAYLLQYDDYGWTTLQSLANQVAELDLTSFSEWELKEISAYINVNGGTVADAVDEFENAWYLSGDYGNYTDLAIELISEGSCSEELLANHFDYGEFGDSIINSYDTSTSDGAEYLYDMYGTDDSWAIGEYYMADVYGDVEKYIKQVGLEDAMEYFNYESYGNDLMTGGNVHFDNNTKLWVLESMNHINNKKSINERKDFKMRRRLSNRMTERRMPIRMTEGESGGWVVEPWEAWEAYEMACEYMGKEDVDYQILKCLGDDELSSCLAYIFRMNDFREWDERNSRNESINRRRSLRRRNK
jgi:hypothetical protein